MNIRAANIKERNLPTYDFFDFDLWRRLFPNSPPPTPAELAAVERELSARRTA